MSAVIVDPSQLEERISRLLGLATAVCGSPARLDDEIRAQAAEVRQELVSRELAAIPIIEIDDLGTEELRSKLTRAGLSTADDLARVPSADALKSAGISRNEADIVLPVIDELRRAVANGLVVQLDSEDQPASHTRLLQTAWSLSAADIALEELRPKIDWALRELPALQSQATTPRGGLFGRGKRSDREKANAAAARLRDVLGDPWTRDLEEGLSVAAAQVSSSAPAQALWDDYVRREPEYLAWLRDLAALPSGDEPLHLLRPLQVGRETEHAGPKQLLAQGSEALEVVRRVQAAPDALLSQVRVRLAAVRDELLSAELRAISIHEVGGQLESQLRKRLESAGLRTLYDLIQDGSGGRQSAGSDRAAALALQTRDLMRGRLSLRLDPVVRSKLETRLLESCALYVRAQAHATELAEELQVFSEAMKAVTEEAGPAASRLKMFLSTPGRRGKASRALDRLAAWLKSDEFRIQLETFRAAADVVDRTELDGGELWANYEEHDTQLVEWFRRLADPPLTVAPEDEVIPVALATRGVTRSRKEVVTEAQALVDRSKEILGVWSKLQGHVVPQFEGVREDLVERQLSSIPTERLRETTGGHLVLAPIAKAGYKTVLHVLQARRSQLEAISGVGDQTALKAIAAARQLASVIEADIAVRLDPDERAASQTALLSTLWLLRQADRLRLDLEEKIERLVEPMKMTVAAAQPAASRFSLFTTDTSASAALEDTYERVERWIDEPAVQQLATALREGVELLRQGPDESELWRDYERKAPEYYALLGELADLSLDVDAAHGYVPIDVAETVNSLHLDDTFLNVSLRGYQTFGAKFALVQRQAILGDEMGLGKTIEAIAAMAHLRSIGGTHFLTVCPVSVLFNWMFEVRRRSRLECVQLYGPDRDRNFDRWLSRGGVGVTSYGSLGTVAPAGDLNISMLVVDEAHYVKNPEALRTKRLFPWIDAAERTLFLTGTPLENRLEEFRNLVTYLLPDPPESIMGAHVVAGASTFRKAVSPVYLRRNQSDVLTELPERLAVDDWVELAGESADSYRAAVAAGKFMDMRRAAYDVESAEGSPKLRRLLDIVEESRENGWKVVVFSYFHRVLKAVEGALEGKIFGPLTGGTSAEARQRLVDEFSAVEGHAVIVAQVEAGGTGLNMQAASVVVLAEPQVKPTLEEQAIARCHRMGQVRRVHVHRLLARDSVDERMLEILEEKKRIFDEYVRDSALKEAAPDSIDISQVDVARMVAAEQERLGVVGADIDSRSSDGVEVAGDDLVRD